MSFNIQNILQSLLYLLVFPGGVFAIFFALLLSGADRILAARMQLRQGPPLLQPVYDTCKLFGKDIIIPRSANEKAFIIAPIIGIAAMLVIPMFIPIFNNSFISYSADIIVIIYLLTIPAVCLVVGGSSSGSFWGGIGSSREVVAMIGYELPMVISLLAVAKKAGTYLCINTTYSMEKIAQFQITDGMSIINPVLIPAAIAFLMIIPAETGTVPFDMAEAETEICEGPLAEYSGIYLAMYKLTSNLKALVMSSIFVTVFLGGEGITFFSFRIINLILNIIIYFILVAIVMFISVTLVRTIVGRFKINQGLKFFWTIPACLSLISLILVVFGV